MADRQQIIDTYREMRAELLASFEGLDEAQMLDRSSGEWCVKDILLHISIWDELRGNEVERISAGGRSVFLETEGSDAFNNAMAEIRADTRLDHVRWELDYTRRRLLEAIERAPERALGESLYGEAPLLSRHELEHAAQIRDWRKAKGS